MKEIRTVALFVLPFLAAPLFPACRPDTGFVEDAIIPLFGKIESTADTVGRYTVESVEEQMSYEITESGEVLIIHGNDKGLRYELIPLDSLRLPQAQRDTVDVLKEEGEDLITDNLCRSWVPAKTAATVKGKGFPTVGVIFDGCKVGDFFSYMDRNGMSIGRMKVPEHLKGVLKEAQKIRREYDAGYGSLEVTKVIFTHNGTFIIGLSDREPYVGSWYWTDKEDKELHICFNLNDESRTEVNTRAYVAFNGEGCDLTFDAGFTSKGKKMSAWIDLICPLGEEPCVGAYSEGVETTEEDGEDEQYA